MNELTKKCLIVKTNNTFIQFFRYFISGGTAFLAYMVLLFILTEYLGIFHLLSLVIAYSISIGLNFIISKFFVFQNRNKRAIGQLCKFFTIAFTGLLLQFLFVYIGTELLHMEYLIANIIASAIIYVFSFSLNKLISFKEAPYEQP
jgi:putative flippase GtrA